jgi:cation diffusion facilitator family transporter
MHGLSHDSEPANGQGPEFDAMNARKRGVAWLSVLSNTVLVVIKLLVGLMIGSVAVISEAIHSGIDLIAAMIALFAVTRSSKPADDGHHYGHGKVENLSGAIEAILIFVAAGWIIKEAIEKLLHPGPIEQIGWGVAVMLVSSIANIIISRKLFKIGNESDSVALKADAWHLLTDVYTSAGVMAGLALMWAGEKMFVGVHLHWMDPVAALVVATLIIKAAYELTMQAGHDLLDGSLPEEDEKWMRHYLEHQKPVIRGYHGLRTRKAGSVRIVDVHILVDPHMTVFHSHEITDEIKRGFAKHFPVITVTVHVEPDNEAERKGD